MNNLSSLVILTRLQSLLGHQAKTHAS